MAAISEERINLSKAARLKLSSETKVAQTQQFNIHCIRPGTLKLVDFAETKALFLPMAENFSSHRILTSPSQKERHPDGGRGQQNKSVLLFLQLLNYQATPTREKEGRQTRARRSRLQVSFPAHELGGCSTRFIKYKNKKKNYLSGCLRAAVSRLGLT